jgi:hypothetical protein
MYGTNGAVRFLAFHGTRHMCMYGLSLMHVAELADRTVHSRCCNRIVLSQTGRGDST